MPFVCKVLKIAFAAAPCHDVAKELDDDPLAAPRTPTPPSDVKRLSGDSGLPLKHSGDSKLGLAGQRYLSDLHFNRNHFWRGVSFLMADSMALYSDGFATINGALRSLSAITVAFLASAAA